MMNMTWSPKLTANARIKCPTDTNTSLLMDICTLLLIQIYKYVNVLTIMKLEEMYTEFFQEEENLGHLDKSSFIFLVLPEFICCVH